MNISDTLDINEIFEQGEIFEDKGNYLNAIKAYSYCLLLASESDWSITGQCNNNLSNLYWRNGNKHKALEFGIKAVEIFEINKKENLQIVALHRLIQLYISDGNIEQAEKLLLQTKHIGISIDDSNAAENLRLQGVISFFKTNFEDAILLYKKSLAINEHNDQAIEASIDMGNIAESYEQLSNIDSALHYYRKALEIQSKKNFNSGLIFIHYGMGQTYVKQKAYNKARDSYDKSIKLMYSIGEKRELPFVLGLMSDLYLELNNYKKAYSYQKQKAIIKDSIFMIGKQERYEELKIEYEVEKAWKENEFLRKENDLKNDQLNSSKRIVDLQKIVLGFIILGLTLSIIFTVVFFNSQKRLRKANKSRDKLFSIIAHDLRGPIGNAMSISELILQYDPIKERDEIDKFVMLLKDSLGSTFNLLEELLSWSKTQMQSLSLEIVKVNLHDLFEESIIHLEHAWYPKQITIVNNLAKEPFVNIDKSMIQTVIRNILSNAIKFSHPKGKVEIYETKKGDFVEITVKDYGVGIAKENINKVLNTNSFHTTYGTKYEKGTGLGLILCQEFIKQNKGSIRFESHENQGTSFIFTLPLFT